MQAIRWVWIAALAISGVGAMASAQDTQPPAGVEMEAMGPMGPPQEIKDMAFLVGTWNVSMQMRMQPDMPWMASSGTAKYKYVVGGAALQMDYESEVMGMPFVGVSQTTFNRETGEWTDTWIDNMGAYLSVYTGKMTDGKKVLSGKDYMMGKVWLSRATTWDVTDSSYKWQMEHSTDDGKTWYVAMKADYAKQSR